MSTAATETKKGIGKAGILDASIMDELKHLGWRVEKLESGWSAHEIAGDGKIGPATSLAALKTQINLKSGPPAAKGGNGKGNGKMVNVGSSTLEDGEFRSTDQRLPTMEEPEIDELNWQAEKCITAKEKRDQAKTAFDDECDVMRAKMHEYDRKRYNRRGFSLVIEDSEKLVIKKAEQGVPKNPRVKKDKTVAV